MPSRLESFFLRKTSTARLQLDALDGLRGIAVIVVVLSHMSNAHLYLVPGADFRGTGKYGVYLFFVLSAFLLTRPLLRPEADLRDARGWARYAARRALRVLPLYWIVLFTNWGVARWAPTPAMPSLTTDELIRHLLLVEGKGVYWTIPVELSYYAILPFVAAGYRALRLDLVRIAVATGLAVAAATWLWPVPEGPGDSLNVGVYLPVFVLGSFAAAVDMRWSDVGRRGLATLAAAGGLALVVGHAPAVGSWWLGEELPTSWMHGRTLPFGIGWSLVVLGALHGAPAIGRVLSWRALRLVGVTSFSIYLWHVPVARSVVLAGPESAWLTSVTIVLVTAAVGCVSFALFEWPLTRSPFIGRAMRRLAAAR